jgi:peptidylprolyl isomerase
MMRHAKRGPLLLLVGTALGIALAAVGVAGGGAGRTLGLPAGAVARVNGELVTTEEYERTLGALATDRRAPLDAAMRRHVLDRLIDEELLVQRALGLGVARRDIRVRRELTAAVVDAVVAGSEQRPTAADVERFYAEHADFFVRPGRLHVRQVWCRVPATAAEPEAAARAGEAARRLRTGERFESVRDALGNVEQTPLPDAPLALGALLEQVGPTALRATLALAPGAVTDPVRSGTGYHVLQLVRREPDRVPPLAEIASEVEAEMRRRAGDDALRAYLADLRAAAEVDVMPELP